MGLTTPLINGVNYSWANISVVLFGVPVIGINSINYKRKQKKDDNYGAGQKPISRGYGNYEFEGDIELYLDEVMRIIASAPDRDLMQIPPFDIQIVFSGRGVDTAKHVLRMCEFTEDDFGGKSGDTKLFVKLPLKIADIEK